MGGLAPGRLLDTYTAERRPVAARVLRNTRAQIALMRPGPQVEALREVLAEVLEIPDARQHFIDMANGLDVAYAPQPAHPLVGRFTPVVDAALRRGRGVLLGETADAFTDWFGPPVTHVTAEAVTGTGAPASLVRQTETTRSPRWPLA